MKKISLDEVDQIVVKGVVYDVVKRPVSVDIKWYMILFPVLLMIIFFTFVLIDHYVFGGRDYKITQSYQQNK